MAKAYAKNHCYYSHTFLLVNIVSVLVTPQIFCLATGAIISGVREAGANQA